MWGDESPKSQGGLRSSPQQGQLLRGGRDSQHCQQPCPTSSEEHCASNPDSVTHSLLGLAQRKIHLPEPPWMTRQPPVIKLN